MQPSVPVTAFDASLHALLQDMKDSLEAEDALGIAAIQIGVPKRVLLMDFRPYAAEEHRERRGRREVVIERSDGGDPFEFYTIINPVFIHQSEKQETQDEYCLSVPDVGVPVTRPWSVGLRYQTPSGEEREIHASGLLARCLQHEFDHLEGITLMQRASPIKRAMILRRLQK
jgi:peptide deformylase